MTYSLLAIDSETGALGGVAATGNLCVGGWVLRATAAGASATQGALPSTLWGEEALRRMADGETADAAVSALVDADSGRARRQLAAIDVHGGGGVFSGADNAPIVDQAQCDGAVAAGNFLANRDVISCLLESYQCADGDFRARLLAALVAATAAGGDKRGVMSAALLIVSPAAPPLSLRVDHADDPIAQLLRLSEKTLQPDYVDWLQALPTPADPHRDVL